MYRISLTKTAVILFLLTVPALVLPATGITPLWAVNFSSRDPGMALSEDGSLILLSAGENITAFSSSGTALWQYPAGMPVISRDGTRVAADFGNQLILLDSMGRQLWNVTMPPSGGQTSCTGVKDRVSTVAINADGSAVAAGTTEGTVFSVAGNGTVAWYREKDSPAARVLITSRGDFIFSSPDSGKIFAFNGSGNVDWWQVLPDRITDMVPAGNDSVITGSDGGEIRRYNRTGDRAWTYLSEGAVRDLDATPEGSILIAEAGWTLYSLDHDGYLRWSRELDAAVGSVSISSGGQTIAAGTANGTAFCFDGNGTLLWTFVPRTSIMEDFGQAQVAVTGNGRYVTVLACRAPPAPGRENPCTLYLFPRDQGPLRQEPVPPARTPATPATAPVPGVPAARSAGPVLFVTGLALVASGLFWLHSSSGRASEREPATPAGIGNNHKIRANPGPFILIGAGLLLLLCGAVILIYPAPAVPGSPQELLLPVVNTTPLPGAQPQAITVWTDIRQTLDFDAVSGGIIPSGRIAWEYRHRPPAGISPVASGRIFLTGFREGVTALNVTTGSLIWQVPAGFESYQGSPAVGWDKVYVLTEYGTMALNASTGARVWVLPVGNPGRGESPVIGNVTVIVRNSDTVYAADAATGRIRWRFKGYRLPLTFFNGSVYVPRGTGEIAVLSEEDGSTIRTITNGDTGYGSLVIANGRIYTVTGQDLSAYSLDSGGRLWKVSVPDYIYDQPAVTDAMVYISGYNRLFALDAGTGEERWNFTAPYGIRNSPAVADGVLYFGGSPEGLYALNATSGEQLWMIPVGITSIPTVADGMVYAGYDYGDGVFYAIK